MDRLRPYRSRIWGVSGWFFPVEAYVGIKAGYLGISWRLTGCPALPGCEFLSMSDIGDVSDV